MIGFKQFLVEGWSRPSKSLKHWADPDYWEHNKKVAGHKVQIRFAKNDDDEKHHTVEYDVDDHYTKAKAKTDSKSGHEIINHVNRHLNQFIRHRKPKGLRFYSGDEKKKKLHAALVSRLARRFGGKTKEEQGLERDAIHKVSFRDKNG